MEIVSDVWNMLTPKEREQIAFAASSVSETDASSFLQKQRALASAAIHPIHAETIDPNSSVESGHNAVESEAKMWKIFARSGIAERIDTLRRETALRRRYVPWAAKSPFLTAFRNKHLTLPTFAAGEWVGFEESEEPFQGNSETGHQHIGSMVMERQTSRVIADAIKNGEFFNNRSILHTIQSTMRSGGDIAFSFMLSGVTGGDGGIHSSWGHLEAFICLLFDRLAFDPAKVKMQAILDGRDSSGTGSVEKSNGFGGYLAKLRDLLGKYGATECLAWLVGRGIAMDRDYREDLVRADWELLTKGKGLQVKGFKGAVEAVERLHSEGFTDQTIPPIVVTGADNKPRVLSDGDAFINLNFRADRQREKMAALLGAKDFLDSEAKARGRNWEFKWLNPVLKIRYCAIASCHPVLDSMENVAVAFPEQPLPASILSLWPQSAEGATYALIAESVKAPHMGYFFRGRREFAKIPKAETVFVVPSHSSADNVHSDWDFHHFPAMKIEKIAEITAAQTEKPSNKLICCNLAATDMIGHLLPRRFDAAVAAYEATDAAVRVICEHAERNGWHIVLTADHGNIEENNPSHTSNNVLTTIASPKSHLSIARNLPGFHARLFDIGYTAAVLLGMETTAKELMKKSPHPLGHKFAGRMLLERSSIL